MKEYHIQEGEHNVLVSKALFLQTCYYICPAVFAVKYICRLRMGNLLLCVRTILR